MSFATVLAIDALALQMPPGDGHPNRVPFRGVLTQIDVPSTRAPQNASGHRVLIPHAVAEQALPSLLGMPVNVAPTMRDHDKKIDVGIITSAVIEGQDLLVEGHLFGKNFPEEVEGIQRHRDHLGMSFEADVHVEDATTDVWVFAQLIFTGAAILEKTAAAYEHTAIAAQAGEEEMMAGEVSAILDELKTLGTRMNELVATRTVSSKGTPGEEQGADDATLPGTEGVAAPIHAAPQEEPSEEEEAAAQRLLPGLLAMLRHGKRIGHKEEATAERTPAMAATLGRIMLQALEESMTEDAVHDDETEDRALFHRLLRQYATMHTRRESGEDGTMRRKPPEQPDDVQASIALITETLNKQATLLADMQSALQAMASPKQESTDAEAPARKTLAATGVVLGPFDGESTDAKMTMAQIDAALDKAGLYVGEQYNRERLTKKIALFNAGMVAAE